MLIIYTGTGKGKTTAAFGLALRASGYGQKVCILQFVKEESWPEGARVAIRKHLKNITIKALGSGFVGIMGDQKPLEEHQQSAAIALKEAEKAIRSKKYNLIILDELLGSLHGGLLNDSDVQNLLLTANRYPLTALVLTGRHAPQWLIDKADLVTEMKEVKHPFQKGLQAKKGIDF
ncbi:hypothetical protein A2721_01735 [Candidatus Gottesmanbacteria bacterium RIFCSPHIGHO2_01_FULL_47_48]|uniref:Cob(I)yrinic acid a,c-diamide adenosyltransferase n=1 Tax=Candidatus Gottesmanbacteria bacterium RIFCSPHIGHO2_01_FULL_47_48 TaxID=1798381 RepID=A0A1F6A1D6_9BACT|nr:MAG: hypothetical protein A2721_01735 [Candidatus Gottesmanbacteria bacterium RIFCSPHIGHO2_01_FULL_47_48]